MTRQASYILRLAVVTFTLLVGTLAAAQDRSQPLPPGEAFTLSQERTAEGETRLSWEIAEGYYLYRDKLTVARQDGSTVHLDLPPGNAKDDPTFGEVVVFYDGVSAILPSTSGPLTVGWQGCQEDGICYPPQNKVIDVGGGDAATAAEPSGTTSQGGADDAGAAITLDRAPGLVESLGATGGAGWVLLAFLGLGLLLAFTPCVLPMFPIVLGMLARQGETLSARRGGVLAGAYVLAMASALGLLGIAAAWSGQNLQVVLQSPWAVGAVAVIFVVLALSMFGLFELRMPTTLAARLSGVGGKQGSLGGAAALGFTSALIVGPCVTAPLAGALLYIAQTGDVILGAAALFTLGLGQGVPLVALGVLGPRALPRSGAWMLRAKQAFGGVFIAMAIWLIGRLLPVSLTLGLWSAFFVALGVFLGALDRLEAGAGAIRRAATALGLLALMAGGLAAIGAASGATDPLRPLAGLRAETPRAEIRETAWAQATGPDILETTLASAPEGQASLVYVTAEWCVTCHTIERSVFPDPEVQAALDTLTTIKADVTELGVEGQAMLDQLGAVGPPTMVFLDGSRAEVPDTRLVGKVSAKELIASVEAAP